MIKYEKEEYNVEEIQNIEENICFEADDFKSIEAIEEPNEEYKVMEIEERKEELFSSKKITDKKTFKQKINQLKDSINSLTTTTVTSSMIVVVAVGTKTIVPNILEPIPTVHEHIVSDEWHSDEKYHWHVCECGEIIELVVHTFDQGIVTKEPTIDTTGEEKFSCMCGYSYVEQIPAFKDPTVIDYGEIEFLNYAFDYNESSSLTLFFNNELIDGANTVVINKETNEELKLIGEKVVFENLYSKEYEFEIVVYDESENIVLSKTINIDLSNHSYLGFGTYNYTITYNEDGTSNLYILLDNKDAFNSIELYLKDDNNKLNYESIIDDNLIIFENIEENNFYLEGKSYYIDQNSHTIYQYFNEFNIDTEITFNVAAEFDELRLSTPYQTEGDLKVVIDYLDTSEKEEIIVDSEEISGQVVTLILSRIVEEFNLTIEGNFYISEPNDVINNTKGNYYKEYTYSQIVKPELYSYINLEKVEILNDSYSEMYTDYDYGIPTKLYFDGYILESDSLTINVYDSNKTVLLDSIENIKSLDNSISFFNLTDEVLFEYIIYSNDVEIIKEEYKVSVSIPEEYMNLDFYINHINPNSVFVTYNDDGTYNAYFDLGFTNNTSYQIENRIQLVYHDDLGEQVGYQYQGSDSIGVIYNIKSDQWYGLKYSTFVKDGINYYAASDLVVPSGTIDVYMVDNAMEASTYFEEVSTGIYEASVTTVLDKDVEIEVILDNSEIIEIVIPYDEIVFDYSNLNEKISSIITLDLSSYTFETAEVKMTLYGNLCYGNGTSIMNSGIDIVGQQYCMVIYNVTINK